MPDPVQPAVPAPAVSDPQTLDEDIGGRITLGGRSLRSHTARGTIVNGVFLIGLYSLSLIRGFVVAVFLSVSDFGLWGLIVITLTTIVWLKQVGVGDKYVQQAEPDQEAAFAKAFTLELIFTGVVMVLALVAIPIAALVYGQTRVIAPGLVLVLALPATALQAPLWIYYRRMDFVRQRKLQAIDPLVAFVVTVTLAAAGASYWSLVVGVAAGAWAGALVAVRATPVRLALRYDARTMREYVSFSLPVMVASGTGIVLAQSSILVGEQVLGLAGVGFIVLAATISDYTNRVDAIVTETLYPAICAVRDRTEILAESFVKSNRLALMWGMPFGIGLALFAPDLVEFVLGSRWRPGVTLIQAFGAIAAVSHIGFNWDAFYRARGETRPLGIAAAATMIAFLAIAIPLLVVDHLDGLAIGMGIVVAINLAVRGFYLTRLFPGLRFVRHGVRAIAPTVPAVLAVLAARALETGSRDPVEALLELVVFVAVVAAATWWLERGLLREVIGYLRRVRPAPRRFGDDGAPSVGDAG
jgi:O-antigen/teichoic acid export membrane protein